MRGGTGAAALHCKAAAKLGRDRKAVHRDVKLLHGYGLLRLRKQVNLGHGQVQIVEANARRSELTSVLRSRLPAGGNLIGSAFGQQESSLGP